MHISCVNADHSVRLSKKGQYLPISESVTTLIFPLFLKGTEAKDTPEIKKKSLKILTTFLLFLILNKNKLETKK